METSVDGSLSLSAQQNAINGAQQAEPCLLTNYKKGDPAPTNFASFVDAPLGQAIANVLLVEIKSTDVFDKIVAAQKAAGKALVCRNPTYVLGKESDVAAFR
jgi:hypothetical protein